MCKHIASDLIQTSPHTIFDVCCGTGVLGQVIGKLTNSKRIVGIDIVPEAVEAARSQFSENK